MGKNEANVKKKSHHFFLLLPYLCYSEVNPTILTTNFILMKKFQMLRYVKKLPRLPSITSELPPPPVIHSAYYCEH